MAESTPKLDLRDIPDVRSLLPSPTIPTWVWIVAACLLIVALVFWKFRKKRSSTHSPTDLAYQEACAALQTATISSTSLIFRRYLAAVCGDSSIFETHEEFLARHDALDFIPEPFREEMNQFFDLLARSKYAPKSAPIDVIPIKNQARSLIDRIHTLATTMPPSLT